MVPPLVRARLAAGSLACADTHAARYRAHPSVTTGSLVREAAREGIRQGRPQPCTGRLLSVGRRTRLLFSVIALTILALCAFIAQEARRVKPDFPESRAPSESPKNARLPPLIFRRDCGTLMVRGTPPGGAAAGTPAVLVMGPIRTHIIFTGCLSPAVNCRPPPPSLPCAGAGRTLEAAKRRGGDPPAVRAGYTRVHTALAEAAFKH